MARSEHDERDVGHRQPQQSPMLKRYLTEEDRLQKFLAGPAEQHTQGKEKVEGKQMAQETNNGSSGDKDTGSHGRPQTAGNTSLARTDNIIEER